MRNARSNNPATGRDIQMILGANMKYIMLLLTVGILSNCSLNPNSYQDANVRVKNNLSIDIKLIQMTGYIPGIGDNPGSYHGGGDYSYGSISANQTSAYQKVHSAGSKPGSGGTWVSTNQLELGVQTVDGAYSTRSIRPVSMLQDHNYELSISNGGATLTEVP
jgi:hypothetical protein